MMPDELDALRRRLIVGAAGITSIIYLLLLRFEPNRPTNECLMGLFVGALFLFIMWLAYP